MNKEVWKPRVWWLTCGNRAGTTAVDASAAGILNAELDGGDPIGEKIDQAKTECR